jgi:DNA repair exonuclease SbcCD ATPase subunit
MKHSVSSQVPVRSPESHCIPQDSGGLELRYIGSMDTVIVVNQILKRLVRMEDKMDARERTRESQLRTPPSPVNEQALVQKIVKQEKDLKRLKVENDQYTAELKQVQKKHSDLQHELQRVREGMVEIEELRSENRRLQEESGTHKRKADEACKALHDFMNMFSPSKKRKKNPPLANDVADDAANNVADDTVDDVGGNPTLGELLNDQ